MTAIAISAAPGLPEWLQKLISFMAALVTNAGFANITAGWHGYASRARYLQWGEGSGQTAASNAIASAGNTTEARTAGTTSQETENETNDTLQVVGTITALEALAVTELGIFDAAGSGTPPTGGNMGMYADFDVVNLALNDSISFTYRVTFS